MNNRKKGHDLERQVSKDLRELFPFTKTSRNSSKLLDDTGIDIVFVPFKIQCKRGYNKVRPKFETLKQEVIERSIANFPKEHVIHQLPFVLIHKLDSEKRNSQNHFQVTMDYNYFLWLLKNLDKETLTNLPILC